MSFAGYRSGTVFWDATPHYGVLGSRPFEGSQCHILEEWIPVNGFSD